MKIVNTTNKDTVQVGTLAFGDVFSLPSYPDLYMLTDLERDSLDMDFELDRLDSLKGKLLCDENDAQGTEEVVCIRLCAGKSFLIYRGAAVVFEQDVVIQNGVR